jgi:hypothetical protein
MHGGLFRRPPDGLLSNMCNLALSRVEVTPLMRFGGTRPRFRNAVQQVFWKRDYDRTGVSPIASSIRSNSRDDAAVLTLRTKQRFAAITSPNSVSV